MRRCEVTAAELTGCYFTQWQDAGHVWCHPLRNDDSRVDLYLWVWVCACACGILRWQKPSSKSKLLLIFIWWIHFSICSYNVVLKGGEAICTVVFFIHTLLVCNWILDAFMVFFMRLDACFQFHFLIFQSHVSFLKTGQKHLILFFNVMKARRVSLHIVILRGNAFQNVFSPVLYCYIMFLWKLAQL